MLSRSNKPPTRHSVVIELDGSLFQPFTSATKQSLISEVAKFILLNRSQLPCALDDLRQASHRFDEERAAQVESGQPLGKAWRRPPSALRRINKLLAAFDRMLGAVVNTHHSAVHFALTLGSTSGRAKELYAIHFEVPQTAESTQHMATGQMPLPGKKKEATRKLLRKLLTDLASIPAWDVQPGPTKLHLLAHAPASIVNTNTKAAPGAAGAGATSSNASLQHSAVLMQLAPYVPPGSSPCDAAPLGGSFTATGMAVAKQLPPAAMIPKAGLDASLSKIGLQVDIIICPVKAPPTTMATPKCTVVPSSQPDATASRGSGRASGAGASQSDAAYMSRLDAAVRRMSLHVPAYEEEVHADVCMGTSGGEACQTEAPVADIAAAPITTSWDAVPLWWQCSVAVAGIPVQGDQHG